MLSSDDTIAELLMAHGQPLRNGVWTGNGFAASTRHGAPIDVTTARSSGSLATSDARNYGSAGAAGRSEGEQVHDNAYTPAKPATLPKR